MTHHPERVDMPSGTPDRSEGNPADCFDRAFSLVDDRLSRVVDRDWCCLAGTLDWSCWQTADHLVDCIFSYALQLSARSEDGFLPFAELHALPDATNNDLLKGLRGVGRLFSAVLRTTPEGTYAGDGLLQLNASDWAQRGTYELLVHAYDIMSGLGEAFQPSLDLCEWLLDSQSLWMLDKNRALQADNRWSALLLASGRPAT